MVIGFSGSSLTQNISSYAVYGTTTSGVTTFTNPILLKQGTGIYAGFSEANPGSASLTPSSSTFTTTGSSDTATMGSAVRPESAGRSSIWASPGRLWPIAITRSRPAPTRSPMPSAAGELLIPQGQTSGSIVLGLGQHLRDRRSDGDCLGGVY